MKYLERAAIWNLKPDHVSAYAMNEFDDCCNIGVSIISARVDIHSRGKPGVWVLAWPGVRIPHILTLGHSPSVENVAMQRTKL